MGYLDAELAAPLETRGGTASWNVLNQASRSNSGWTEPFGATTSRKFWAEIALWAAQEHGFPLRGGVEAVPGRGETSPARHRLLPGPGGESLRAGSDARSRPRTMALDRGWGAYLRLRRHQDGQGCRSRARRYNRRAGRAFAERGCSRGNVALRLMSSPLPP